MNEFERSVLEFALRGDHPILSTLRDQLSSATLREREDYNSAGFFTHIDVPDDAPRLKDEQIIIGDVSAEMPGGELPMGFLVWIENGALDCLEAFTYEDYEWPENPSIQRLFYTRNDNGTVSETDERILGEWCGNEKSFDDSVEAWIKRLEAGKDAQFQLGMWPVDFADGVTPVLYNVIGLILLIAFSTVVAEVASDQGVPLLSNPWILGLTVVVGLWLIAGGRIVDSIDLSKGEIRAFFTGGRQEVFTPQQIVAVSSATKWDYIETQVTMRGPSASLSVDRLLKVELDNGRLIMFAPRDHRSFLSALIASGFGHVLNPDIMGMGH